jgi:hypothetical protein
MPGSEDFSGLSSESPDTAGSITDLKSESANALIESFAPLLPRTRSPGSQPTVRADASGSSRAGTIRSPQSGCSRAIIINCDLSNHARAPRPRLLRLPAVAREVKF